jgi:hypothetical protein
MDKLFQVNDRIYRSARPLSEDSPIIAALGIKSRLILEKYSTAFPFNLVERYEPMSGYKLPTPENLQRLVKLIMGADKPLLINCQHGVDRTGIVVAAYRIIVENRTINDAWKECEARGMSKFLWWWKKCLKNI